MFNGTFHAYEFTKLTLPYCRFVFQASLEHNKKRSYMAIP
jgi:hypothetical protein